MNLKSKMTVMFLGITVLFTTQALRATVLSVRLIKSEASYCSQKPELYFSSNPSSYSIVSKEWYNGENAWEIFFEIETKNANIPIENFSITAKGVNIARAIVGRTDVVFNKADDTYQFTLVKDTTNGRHIQTAYQNPKGGPFMWIYHNWKDRANGKYNPNQYPEKILQTCLNYEVACQEMLRLMGDMNGINQTFNGELILLNCESSAPRAHLDFPPHWHLQHWEHGHSAEYGIKWREKQYIISHYYIDSMGNITSDKQSLTQNYKSVKRTKNEFFSGDTCTWNDSKGNLIFKQIIKNGTLNFIKPNGDSWTLKPHIDGGDKGIWVCKNDRKIAFAAAQEDGANGITTITIDAYNGNKKTNSWSETIKFDPFTGNARSN